MGPRPNLDFLRSLAILAVLADHTALNAGHQIILGLRMGDLGVFGVYLFFVHTCLVLMWSLERRPHTLDFYVRRIFRIYPLAIVMIATIAILHLHLNAGPVTPSMLLSNLLLLQDIWSKPLMCGVLWSLPLELGMYLFLPMFFAYAKRELALWPFLLYWVFACAAILAMHLNATGNNLFTTLPHFLPGVLAYIGYKHRSPRWPFWAFALLLLSLATGFALRPSVSRGWVVCLIVGLLLPSFREAGNRVLTAVSHQVAQYSYSVYLLHPFAILLAFGHMHHAPLWTKIATELVVLIPSSFLSYHFIEAPGIKLGSRVANRLQSRFGSSFAPSRGLDLA